MPTPAFTQDVSRTRFCSPVFLFYATFLPVVLFTAGCGKKAEPIRFYCGEPFVEPVGELLPPFLRVTGLHVSLYGINSPIEFHTEDEVKEAGTGAKSSGRDEPDSDTPRPGILRSDYKPDPTGIAPDVRAMIDRFSVAGTGDLWLNDSPNQLKYLEAGGYFASQTPVCFLAPVPLSRFSATALPQPTLADDASQTAGVGEEEGEPPPYPIPASLPTLSLDELALRQKTLGVLGADRSGLGEVSESILAALEKSEKSGKEPTAALTVRIYPTQRELFAALEREDVDAIIVWDASAREHVRRRGKPAPEQASGLSTYAISGTGRLVMPVYLVSLSSTLNYAAPPKMVRFLVSRNGREVFKKHGFYTK